MNCSTCNFALPERATFCPNCGKPMPKNVSNPELAASPTAGLPAAIPPPPSGYNIPPSYTAPPPNLYAPPPQSQPALPQYPPYATPQPPYSPAQQVPFSSPPPSVQFSTGGKSLPLATSAEKPTTLEHHAEPSHEHTEGHAHTETPDAHEEHEENANERLLLFSDGIIAFAITIAAISIKVTSDDINSITYKYFAYIISFVIVALSWNEHHRLFHYIKRNDLVLVILNAVYLAAIVVIPIGLYFLELTTLAFDANNGSSLTIIGESALIFLGSQAIAGIALLLIWWYASRRHRLIEPEVNPRLITYITLRLIVGPISLLVLILLVFFPPAGLVGLAGIVGLLIYRRWYRRGLNTSSGSTDIGRILLFSDAVIGIAITIIAAQIDFPAFKGNEEVLKAFTDSLPLLTAFGLGFVMMLVYWLIHYRMLRYINRHDPWLIVLNFWFLLCIALMFVPINYYVFFYNSQDSTPSFFFGGCQMVTIFVLLLMWLYASRKRRLLDDKITPVQISQLTRILVLILLIFFVLTVASLVGTIGPRTYIFTYLAILGFVLLIGRLIGRLRARRVQTPPVPGLNT